MCVCYVCICLYVILSAYVCVLSCLHMFVCYLVCICLCVIMSAYVCVLGGEPGGAAVCVHMCSESQYLG